MEKVDAEHAETAPEATTPFISKLNCSLVGKTQTIHITPGTLTFRIYGKKKVSEQFHCNYGFNEKYRDAVANRPLKIVGVDTNAEARMVELSNHRFFVATLFLPQLSSTPELTHPLIGAFMKAALAFQAKNKNPKSRYNWAQQLPKLKRKCLPHRSMGISYGIR